MSKWTWSGIVICIATDRVACRVVKTELSSIRATKCEIHLGRQAAHDPGNAFARAAGMRPTQSAVACIQKEIG